MVFLSDKLLQKLTSLVTSLAVLTSTTVMPSLANVTTPHLIYQNFQDQQETKHKSASIELGTSSVTGSIAFGKTKKSTTSKQANIRAQQGTFTVGQTTRIAPRDTESGTGFGLTLSANLSSPQDFARDIGKTVVTAATSIAAAELAHQAGLGDAAASLVGMAAGAYASSQYNQLMQGEPRPSSSSPIDSNSPESRSFIDQVLQLVRSPLSDSGLGLLGEVSYAHGHHRATMALVDVNSQRVQQSAANIRRVFSDLRSTFTSLGQNTRPVERQVEAYEEIVAEINNSELSTTEKREVLDAVEEVITEAVTEIRQELEDNLPITPWPVWAGFAKDPSMGRIFVKYPSLRGKRPRIELRHKVWKLPQA